MKTNYDKVQQKLQGAKVRVGCLETDNAKMRDGMKVFVGKATTDDKLVDLLKNENQDLKRKLRAGAERARKVEHDEKTVRGEGSEIELLKNQIAQLTSQNSHQERIINQLRSDAHRLRNPARKPGQATRPARDYEGGEAKGENDARPLNTIN
jgi:predicted RNase H-like nuclease (RuvC/YqgF family)